MKRYKRNIVKQYTQKKDVFYFGLGSIAKDFVPELKVRYNRGKLFLGKVSCSEDVANFIKKRYGVGQIELQEACIVLFLNHANEIIGYYKHTLGSINEAMADIRIIFSVALNCLATSIIISHNHTSRTLKPSVADIEITEQIEKAGTIMQIKLLDHIIVTKTGYYSFADHGKI